MTGPSTCEPTGNLALDFEPGIGERLLEAERDAALLRACGRLDGENDGVDAVALLEQVGGMANFFGPRHLRDVNEAFEAGLELDECAEISEARDGAGDALAGHVALGGGLPRLGLKLLEAERDFVGLGIDFENAQRELLADGENVFGFGDAGAGDVADVQQAVESGLDFDECAVGHEGADRAGDGVAGFERGAAAGELAAGLLFENDAAIDDDVFIGDVELGDAAGDLLADEGFELGGIARAAAAGGHEGANADVDAEAALDDGGDGAGDGDLFGEGALEGRPVAGLRDAKARELVVALFVAAGDGDGKACRRA